MSKAQNHTKGVILCINKKISFSTKSGGTLSSVLGQYYELQELDDLRQAHSRIKKLEKGGLPVPIFICDLFQFKEDSSGLLIDILNAYPEMTIVVLKGNDRATRVKEVNGKLQMVNAEAGMNKVNYVIGEALLSYESNVALKRSDNKRYSNDTSYESIDLNIGGVDGKTGVIKSFQSDSGYHSLVGESEALQYVMYRVEKVAPITTTVLILGETGTGKELIAEAIHNGSPRKAQPMIKVNCAALPAELIESELFGHEQGAFTGASQVKRGKFEVANGSTLFLDEIGELPLTLQSKILRALESDEITRLGGTTPIKLDTRIIAATNRNLEGEVVSGSFRRDLYYRLNIYPITLPALRQRMADLELLVHHFIEKFNKKIGRQVNSIPDSTMKALKNYDWPGNVRELENVIERGIILSQSRELRVELPEESLSINESDLTLEGAERRAILAALEKSKGKISGKGGAAEYLNINASTLRAKMRKLDLKKDDITYRE